MASVKTAPSILSCDFSRMGDEVKRLEKSSCDYIHVDVMDGHFVPNLTFGPAVVKAIRPFTSKPFDVHLMMSEPEKYVAEFRKSGADLIGIHREIHPDPRRLIELLREIRRLGAKACLTYNPPTGVDDVEIFLPECDQVLVMSVNPGFGGQSFIPSALDKGRLIRGAIDRSGLSVDLEIDGGINPETAPLARAAGFNVLVAGSFLFSAPDFEAALRNLTGV